MPLAPSSVQPDHRPAGAAGVGEPPPVRLDPDAAVPLRRNRDYLLLLGGQGLSAVGDAVTFTALPLLVLALTGSGLQMGVVGALQTLPDFLFGLAAGALADRWDRRRMMLLADFGRALLTALIPLSAWLGWPTMGVVLLVVGPINVLRVIWLAGWTAAVPSLVVRRQIGPAQSVFEVILNLAFVLGPALAGLAVTVVGPATTIGLDALSFLASVGALTLMRHRLGSTDRPHETHLLHDIREGVSFVARHRLLRAALGLWTLNSLAFAALTPALTYYVTRDRGLSSADLGFVLAAFGAGALLGAVGALRLTRGPLGPLLLGGNLIQGLLLGAASLVGGVAPLAAISFGGGIAAELVAIAYLTLRATVAPNELLGRVGGATRTVSMGVAPIGGLVGGLLLDAVHGAVTLQLMAAWLVAATLLCALSPSLRAARAAP